MADETYDVIVIGAGPTGENVADRAVRGGLTAVIVESELVGGECSYWACMPSKALLRPAEVVARGRRGARRGRGAARPGRGAGPAGLLHPRLEGRRPGRVARRGEDRPGPRARPDRRRAPGRRSGDVVAAGPARGGDRHRHPARWCPTRWPACSPWTSREATSAHAVPGRLVIVGGGVVGCEMAAAWSALGVAGHADLAGRRCSTGWRRSPGSSWRRGCARRAWTCGPGVERDRGASREASAGRDGGTGHADARRRDAVEADEVLVAAGRAPQTEDLGLETVGLGPGRGWRWTTRCG